MTLDEAIAHAHTEYQRLQWEGESDCASQHLQLYRWLKELRLLKADEPLLLQVKEVLDNPFGKTLEDRFGDITNIIETAKESSDSARFLALLGHRLHEFTDDQRSALEEGRLVCPHGEPAQEVTLTDDIRRNIEVCIFDEDDELPLVRVNGTVDAHDDESFAHITWFECRECQNPVVFFLPDDVEMDYV